MPVQLQTQNPNSKLQTLSPDWTGVTLQLEGPGYQGLLSRNPWLRPYRPQSSAACACLCFYAKLITVISDRWLVSVFSDNYFKVDISILRKQFHANKRNLIHPLLQSLTHLGHLPGTSPCYQNSNQIGLEHYGYLAATLARVTSWCLKISKYLCFNVGYGVTPCQSRYRIQTWTRFPHLNKIWRHVPLTLNHKDLNHRLESYRSTCDWDAVLSDYFSPLFHKCYFITVSNKARVR